MAIFNVTSRDERGKAPQLRRKGIVPMSIIDRAHKTHLIQAPIGDLRQAFGSTDSHGMIDVKIGSDASMKAMVKAVDSDPIAHQILSVTFQEVATSDTVNATVPVIADGHNDVLDGEAAILSAVTTEIKIRAKVSDLPESIHVDVSKLGLGEHINAGDVKLPKGVELHMSPDAVIFTVSQIAAPILESEAVTEVPIEEAVSE